MAVATADRLGAELGVTADDLGLTDQAFGDRIDLWKRLVAGEPDLERQYQRVKALLLRNWITALSREADKFRAEGELTIETNIVARIALLQADLASAVAGSGPPAFSPGSANPAPVIEAWGLDDSGWP